MGPALQISIIVFCIIMSSYFSATETAFSTFNRIRVKGLAEKGNKRAATALKLSENYDTLISAILVGNNIVNILATSIATILFIGLINEDLGATVSTVVMTVLILVFGEISPKTIACGSFEGRCFGSQCVSCVLEWNAASVRTCGKIWRNANDVSRSGKHGGFLDCFCRWRQGDDCAGEGR